MPTLNFAEKKKGNTLTTKSANNPTQENSATKATLQNQLGNKGTIAALSQSTKSNTTYSYYIRYHEAKSVLKKNYDDKKILGLIKDGIRTAKKICSDACLKNAEEAALKKFGYFGGVFGKHKSDGIGYQFRSHLKEKTRDWMRQQVDAEYSDYTSEKIDEIDNNSNLSDEEKDTEKLNAIESMNQHKIFLKNELYKEGKNDVEFRLQKESQEVIRKAHYETLKACEETIKEIMIERFKTNFIEVYAKFQQVPEDWGLKVATAKAVETVNSSASKIGENTYKSVSKDLSQKASKDAETRRDEMIQELGGEVNKGKLSFDQVKKDDYKAVEEFVYEKDEEIALSDGTRQAKDVKGEIGKKIRSEEIVAPNISKGFKVLTNAIVMAVPETGDKASAEGIIRIYVAPGAYVSIKLAGEVERDYKDYVTANLSIGFGGGGTAGIAKLHGELGGFIEVTGKNSENLSKLMSYVLYRKARESSVIPHGLTDRLWGLGNRSGETRYKEAEAYGAQLESHLFGKGADADNAAKIGGYGKLSAEIGEMSSGLGGSVEFAGSVGREYSKTSFDSGSGKGRLGKMEKYKFRGQGTKGDRIEKLGFEGKIGGGIAEGNLSAEMELRGKDIEAVTIKGKGILKASTGKSTEKAAEKGVKFVVDLLQNLKATGKNMHVIYQIANKKQTGGDTGKRMGADVALLTSDLGINIKELADGKDKLGEMIGEYEGDAIASAKSSLSFGITYKWEPGSKGTLTFTLSTGKKLSFDAGVAGIEMKRSRDILRWTSGKDMNNFKSLAGVKGGFQA